MLQVKKGLSLVLSLVLVAQLCLPVGAVVVGTPAADLGAGKFDCTHHAQHTAECGYTAGAVCAFDPNTCPDCNPEAEIPEVPEAPAETAVPEEPELPALGAPEEGVGSLAAAKVALDISGANGYIVITDTYYKIGRTPSIPHTGPYILTGTTTATNTRTSHIFVNNTSDTPIEITLQNVNISLSGSDNCAFFIQLGGVNLTLLDTNTLKSGGFEPGLWVFEGGSLTITKESPGSLTADGNGGGAGIGGRSLEISGPITISGGTVNATGGSGPDGGAGIGGGGGSDAGGIITIDGGTVNATGGSGLGNGAIRCSGGAGIGSGGNGKSGTILIGGGNVNATGGSGSDSGGADSSGGIGIGSGGAGIGGGGGSGGGEITITGGTVNATGSKDARSLSGGAGIGGGGDGAGGTITITGGSVNATGGSSYSVITLGDVGEKPGGPGAGIGGGGIGIGGGIGVNSGGAGGTITISGGSVNANGGSESPVTGGAGIGGGNGGAGGAVAVTGGVVTAFGGSFILAGIGDGDGLTKIPANEGTFSTTGNTVIIANEISDISGHTNKTWRGVIFDGAWGFIFEDNHRFTLPGNVTIPSGYSLEMKDGEALTVPPNTTLTVDGHIIRNGGSIIENGSIIHPENILPTGGINISKGDVLIDSSCGANCLGHVITGNNRYTKHSVKVFSGKHKITLYYTDIRPDEPSSAFTISSGAEVELTLVGDNLLGGNREFAALTVQKGGKLTITKESTGTLNAISHSGGAGIGGDSGYESGTINIEGGMVKAAGNGGGAGIGGGWHGAGGTITIDGDAVVVATSTGGESIGNGNDRTGATVNRTRGIIFENKAGKFYGDHVTLNTNVALYPGEDLTIPSGKTLTIPRYKTLTNHATLSLDSGGTLFLDGGTLVSDGTLAGNGTFKTSIVSEDIVDIPDQVYTGKAITPNVKLNSRSISGKTFTVTTEGFTKRYENNTGIGTAKVVYTRSGYPTAEKSFNIVKSGTVFDGGVMVYNGATPTTEFTYGDTITVKAKPVPTGKAALMAAPGTDQMALFLGNTQLCEPVNPDGDGVYTMTYHTTEKALKVGDNTLTVKYVGNNNMADFSQTVTVTLNPKPLTGSVTGTVSKVYDGNSSFGNVPLTLASVESVDAVTATANGTAFSANAGTHAFTAAKTTVSGYYGGYYTLPLSNVSGNVKITPATPKVSIAAAQQGSSLLLTATTGGVNGEKPEGDVTFAHGGTVLGTVIAVDGVANFSWSNPPAGNVTITAYFGASNGNYRKDVVTAAASVTVEKQNQAALTLTSVSGKRYGDVSFALSTTGGSGSGGVSFSVTSGDAFTVSGNTATIVKPGNVTVTATKAGDDNYNPTTSKEITISIGAKPVTVTVTAQNKVYDGKTDAKVSYMVSGTVGGDSLTAAGTAAFADKNVGTGKTVAVSGIAISGDSANKYTLTSQTATTVANIAKKPLSWSADGTVNHRAYNGGTAATVATHPGLVGVVSGDDVTVVNGTVTFANANVGTHAITATNFGVAGTAIGNYTAPIGQPVFANGRIAAKVTTPAVTVSGTYIFNGKQQIPAFTVKDGENPLTSGDYTVTYGANINAGTGTVTVNLKGNYSGNTTKNFTIQKAKSTSVVAPEPILMTEKFAKSYSIPLPAGAGNAGTLTYQVSDPAQGGAIFSAKPAIDGTNLTFTSARNTLVGQTDSVVITISSDNYETFTVTLSFGITTKKNVTLTGLTAVNSTYDGTGKAGYTGTLLIDGNVITKEQIKTLIFTYIGINGTTYNKTTAPTDAGSYKLVVSVDGTNADYTGHHVDIPFTIAKKEVEVTAGSYAVTKPWNGTTAAGTFGGKLGVTGVLKGETVTVAATPRPYSAAQAGSYKVVVDLALDGNDSGNYVLKNSTVEVPGTITAGTAPAANAPKVATVDATAITLQPVAVEGETVEYGKSKTDSAPADGWQVGTEFTPLDPATTYYFFARVQENGNHPAGVASTGTAITTIKKVFEEEKFPIDGFGEVTGSDLLEPRGFRITNGHQWNAELTAQDMLGTFIPADATISAVTPPPKMLVLESVNVKDGKFVFTSRKNALGTNATDTVSLTISSSVYEDINQAVIFYASEKGNAAITATLDGKVYDGKPMEQPIPTAIGDGFPIETLIYTYQWKQGDTNLKVAPKNVGDYTLVISGSDDSYAGSLTLPFTIEKKPLTVTAADKFVVRGDAPVFTCLSDGLVAGETLTDVAYTCAYNKDNPTPGMARTAIIPHGGTVSSGNGNYAINYVPGTLIINPDKEALDAAIKAAEALKSGIEISDKTPDEEPYGKRFVTAEVMTALETAIAAAKQVSENAPPQKLADAMNALAQATDAFKSAIRTGTYSSDSVTRYAITAAADKGGSISPKGTVRVQRGTDKVFTITPDEGYVVADVLVDGVSVGGVSSYTFQKVTKPHTISATFRLWVNPYSDVSEKDWFYKDVQAVTQRNLMSGVGDGRFDPHGTATRATIAAVLYRQAGSPEVKTDGTAWYSAAQAWGIKAGVCDGTNMERTITRQELVTMLHRYAKQLKMDVSIGENTNILSYNDAFTLPQWSIPAFQWACGAGIVSGAGGNLRPTAPATRAEVAAMLQRFAALIAK